MEQNRSVVLKSEASYIELPDKRQLSIVRENRLFMLRVAVLSQTPKSQNMSCNLYTDIEQLYDSELQPVADLEDVPSEE